MLWIFEKEEFAAIESKLMKNGKADTSRRKIPFGSSAILFRDENSEKDLSLSVPTLQMVWLYRG